MKILKTTLFSLLLVTITSLAFGQGQIAFYYTDDDGDGNPPPLRTQCTTGDSLADGTLVSIYWDNDHNGPSGNDVQPAIGSGYAQANQVTFPMNGAQFGLGSGYFVTEFYFFVASLPTGTDTALYYLEINRSDLCLRSSVFPLTPGQLDWYLDADDWTCTTGAPCRVIVHDPPTAPTTLVASDGGCEQVELTWVHDGLDLEGFNIYANGLRVGGAQSADRTINILTTSADVRAYTVKAFNIGGESAASNSDNGDAYLLRFAAGAPGNLVGDSLRGSDHTIHFQRPNADCLSKAWLYLYDVEHNARRGLLASCDTCLQVDFTLPDSAIQGTFRLVLEDSSYGYHGSYTDTTESLFHLVPPDTDAVDVRDYLRPDQFGIAQNYPNPFNPETRIVFNVPQQAEIRLNVYNVMGQLVRTLAAGTYTIGQHEVMWDGRNDGGASVSAGVYLYRLEAPGVNVTKKMLLMK